jgi:hypothetical protein
LSGPYAATVCSVPPATGASDPPSRPTAIAITAAATATAAPAAMPAFSRRVRGGPPGVAGGGPIAAGDTTAGATASGASAGAGAVRSSAAVSAAANSPQLANRFLGSLASALASTASAASPSPGTSEDRAGGGSDTWAQIIAAGCVLTKGGEPDSNSNAAQPSEYWSARASTARPSICSGDA